MALGWYAPIRRSLLVALREPQRFDFDVSMNILLPVGASGRVLIGFVVNDAMQR